MNDKPIAVPLGESGPVPSPLGPDGPIVVDMGGVGGVIPGPPGPTAVSSDPGNTATLGSDDLIYVPEPEGFMEELVYDPAGKRDDAFQMENMSGVLDGGVFT